MEKKDLEFYEKAAKEHRGSVKQVGWGSEAGQKLRFKVIVETMELLDPKWRERRVLDIGCGRGDLVNTLRDNDFRGSYVGVDAVRASLEDARARYEDGDVEFVELMWVSGQPLPEADWMIVSGSFNTYRKDVRQRVVEQILEEACVGAVMNFLRLADGVQYNPACVVTSEQEMLKLVDLQGYRMILRSDYMKYDFTLGVAR